MEIKQNKLQTSWRQTLTLLTVSVSLPQAVKCSAVNGQSCPAEPDIEDALSVASPTKTRLGSVFKKDMVILDLKFCSLAKHSRDPLYAAVTSA
ncbi:MAG: hypothetical protein ACXV7J_00610 [Methylomonas sp.]